MKRMATIAGALLLASGAWAQDRIPIGTIKKLDGAATLVSAGARQPLVLGQPVYQDDVIETAPNGAVGITFRDNTTISIGPETELALDEFVFQPAEDKYGFVTRVSKGTMYFVSGAMAKLSPESVSVKTPTGTIGIRGTRFVVKVDPKGA